MKHDIIDSRGVLIPNAPISKIIWDSNTDIVVYYKDGNLNLHKHFSLTKPPKGQRGYDLLPSKLRGYVNSKKKTHIF